jgi:hypothetical protein
MLKLSMLARSMGGPIYFEDISSGLRSKYLKKNRPKRAGSKCCEVSVGMGGRPISLAHDLLPVPDDDMTATARLSYIVVQEGGSVAPSWSAAD